MHTHKITHTQAQQTKDKTAETLESAAQTAKETYEEAKEYVKGKSEQAKEQVRQSHKKRKQPVSVWELKDKHKTQNRKKTSRTVSSVPMRNSRRRRTIRRPEPLLDCKNTERKEKNTKVVGIVGDKKTQKFRGK